MLRNADVNLNTAPTSFANALPSSSLTCSLSNLSHLFPAIPRTILHYKVFLLKSFFPNCVSCVIQYVFISSNVSLLVISYTKIAMLASL